MSSFSHVVDTFRFIFRSEFWFGKLNFMNLDQSDKFLKSLKDISPNLYGGLSPHKNTIFMRMTGDGFRMSKKSHAVQVSFSLLNNKPMLNSPYGQFLSSLWKGKYSRLQILPSDKYHRDMKNLLLNGAEFELPDGQVEQFNVVPILCADLMFVMAILESAHQQVHSVATIATSP